MGCKICDIDIVLRHKMWWEMEEGHKHWRKLSTSIMVFCHKTPQFINVPNDEDTTFIWSDFCHWVTHFVPLSAKLLSDHRNPLTYKEISQISRATDGYSCSDITSLAREAALGPLRELGPEKLKTVTAEQIRPIQVFELYQLNSIFILLLFVTSLFITTLKTNFNGT